MDSYEQLIQQVLDTLEDSEWRGYWGNDRFEQEIIIIACSIYSVTKKPVSKTQVRKALSRIH